MWCKLTSPYVSLSWLGEADESDISPDGEQLVLNCISQTEPTFSFSLARSPSLSLSSWIKSHWWRIDRIMMVYRVDFRGLFWLSADSPYLWPWCFSSSLTSRMCDFSPLAVLPSEVFVFARRWMRTIGPSLFLIRGGSLGWEKVCATVFPLPAPEVWGCGEKRCQLPWRNETS